MSRPESGPEAESPQQAYFRAVEDLFIDLRGAPLMLSPADWQVARGWFERGIPLSLISAVLRELFERRRLRGAKGRVNRLSFCASAVESAWAEVEALTGPSRSPEKGTVAPLDCRRRLEALAESLPSELPGWEGWRERIRSLADRRGRSSEPEAIERELGEMDRELMDARWLALTSAKKKELEAGVEASLAKLANRHRGADLELARHRLRVRGLRAAERLPVLSLFSSAALGPATAGERGKPSSE